MSKGDRGIVAATVVLGIVWLLGAALSLGLTATIIWAIVEVVKHYTN
jgi:hypothetical protein